MNKANLKKDFNYLFLLNRKKKLFATLRGFRVLKKTNNLGLWESIRYKFLKTSPISQHSFSKIFYSSSINSAKVATHQYCIDRVLRLWIGNQLLIQSVHPKFQIIWPLPKNWIILLSQEKISVNYFLSTLLWWFFVIIIYFYNISKIFILLIYINPIFYKSSSYANKKFYYFDKIFPGNIPIKNDGEGYDLLTWFLKSKARDISISHIAHNVNIKKITVGNIDIEYGLLPYENRLNFHQYLVLLKWLNYSFWISFIDLLRFRFYHAMMLLEATKLKIVEITDDKNIAVEYFFHWSSGVYRPLWTYAAKKRGAEICLYFYSTIESPSLFKRVDNFKSQYWLMNWPKYLCWNDRQKKIIIDNTVTTSTIDVVGPIWFIDNPKSHIKILGNYVAVFCIENFRKTFYIGISSLTDYFEYNQYLPVLFLSDIHYCCAELKIIMAHKRKRNDEKRELKKYRKIIDELSTSKFYKKIAVENSTIRVIEDAKLVICFPFTSVAVQAQFIGKKVVYYDPVFWIDKNDPAANGIEVLHGRIELYEWMTKNV